jgi:Antibiotic biosynthesis monooxygenase
VYARTTTMQGDPARIDAGIAHVRDQVLPAVTAMDGCIGMSMLVDRGSGRCIATTAWDSAAALRDSAERVRPQRDAAERALGSSTGSDVEGWEIAVVHRDHATPDGACARVAWMSGAPDTLERAIDIFKMAVLPKLQALDGFCSASLMVSRETGRTAGTFIYDSRAQLEATREAASRLREAASKERGATIDDVAEMDVAFAHLHVPELV